ncbi:MAG: efflux RND transporter periplasmic adaptor subunit [Candidatus Omnitrophica bacterium]|nr:efflux RND transporter periplasmic adaptor subunit [Candidatus Omnitrophota bacterium]
MIKYRYITVSAVLLAAVLSAIFGFNRLNNKSRNETVFINPVIDDVVLTVATTGVIKPQNRLQVKPSIGGRIEQVMVKEGSSVKSGDILVWMSSTERAALMDAARSQGLDALSYWEQVYKKTPIVSPIDGEVIVRSVEPGQTVTASEAILVLSDRLIVSAQFDETDIGKVKIGQRAFITLDAYPDIRLNGTVDHIAYESSLDSNVTIYDVDIVPDTIPDILRSGMSVTVEVVDKTAENVITVPSNVLRYEGKRQFVLVKGAYGKISERDVKVGLNDNKNAQIISGLSTDDIVVMQNAYLPQKKSAGTNPFMPFDRRQR